MKAPKTSLLVLAMLGLLVTGCQFASYRKASKIMPFGPRLTKVTLAVEDTVRNENPPPTLKDGELVRLAMAHDLRYLGPFKGYRIRAEGRSGHALVMLCSKDGSQALFEDVGCTPNMDIQHWEKPVPCEFTLDVPSICPARSS